MGYYGISRDCSEISQANLPHLTLYDPMNPGSDACSYKMEGIVPGHVSHPQEIALCSFDILRPLISTKLPYIHDLRMTGMGRQFSFNGF